MTMLRCRPCAEAERRDNPRFLLLRPAGVNEKITCPICGRRRYSWECSYQEETPCSTTKRTSK